MNLNDLCRRCGDDNHSTIRCPNAATLLRVGDTVRHRGNGRLGVIRKKISNSIDYHVEWTDTLNPKRTVITPGWVEVVKRGVNR